MQESINEIEFELNITAEDYLNYYRGQIKWVLVTSVCGKRLKFPANLLAPHVTRNGIAGRFILRYLSTGKAIELRKSGV